MTEVGKQKSEIDWKSTLGEGYKLPVLIGAVIILLFSTILLASMFLGIDAATGSIIFSLGLLAGLSPCLFPVLPSYLAYLANTNSNITKGIITSIAVTLGIMTVFVFFGIVIKFISNQVLFFFSNNFRQFQLLTGALLIVLGFALVLKLSVNIGGRLSEFSGSSQQWLQKFENPYISSYLIGVFFAVIAAPCAIIYFLTLFSIVAFETTLNVIIFMLIFSLGAGIPFFLIGVAVPIFQGVLNRGAISTKSISNLAYQINQVLPRLAGVLIIVMGGILINDSDLVHRALADYGIFI